MIQRQPSSVLKRAWRSLLIAAVVASALSSVLPASPAWAVAWYVATTGNNTNSCTSPAAPCRTISFVINQASAGDMINVAAGTYDENVSITKGLTLQGAGAALTIIDGNDLGNVVFVSSNIAGANVNLLGLTIRNGQGTYGGGVFSLNNNGLVTISDSVISGNTAQSGGGIYSQGFLRLVNVKIHDNSDSNIQRGGGLLSNGNADLVNVEVYDNAAQVGGGGISNSGILTLTNSTVSNNQSAEGGGIYNAGSGAQLISNNNTYAGNHASSAGGAIYNATVAIDTGSLITGSLAATSGGGIYNHSTGQLTLNATSLRNNQATSTHGGGLYNDGSATLTGVIVRGNTAPTGIGGGLYSAGTNGALTMLDTLLSDNRAVNGGGLYAASSSGTLTLINCQITNNESDLSGGGLYSNIAATLASVSVSNNRAVSGSGGGIYHTGRQLSILRSTVANNQALTGNGGGLFNGATANLTEATLQNNQSDNGGGLYNNSDGQLSVVGSTWYLNSAAKRGGGLHNQGTLTLTQSTVYSNTSVTQGGSGLYNAGSAQLTNTTLSYNTALTLTGALLNDGGTLSVLNSTISHNAAPALARTGGSIALANTIVAASTGGVNCNSPLTSNGHNLDSGNSCGISATGDIINTDPLLGPLVNNGGATLTRILQSGSSAIDAGSNASCPPIDQRGIARPQGDTCDIGAYEVIGYTNSVTDTIAAGSCVTSTTFISSSYTIGSLHVGANVAFAPRGDLRVKLYSPDNRQIQLLGATGGVGQNLNVLWDDDATQGPVGAEDHDLAVPFFKYVRVPDQSLTPLSGRSLRGAWRLEICNVGANTGTLNRWSLVVPSFGNPRVLLPLMRR